MDDVPFGSAPDEGDSLLIRLLCASEIEELELPHIVVTTFEGHPLTYSGPYPDALAALVAAELEQRSELAAGGTNRLSCRVAALYPGVDAPKQPSDTEQPHGESPMRGQG